METKYKKISHKGIFTVAVEQFVTQEMRVKLHVKLHYEYKFKVEARQTENDFINHFASLMLIHGRRTLDYYEELLGIEAHTLSATLTALSGVSFGEWCEEYVSTVAEKLLRETTIPIHKIAAIVGWTSESTGQFSFTNWFVKRYKCSPRKWRNAALQQ